MHTPFIREVGSLTVVNSGSVGLPFDGDSRASYLVLDHGRPSIRRVAYDIDKEIAALEASHLPYAGWIARSLRTAAPQMP